MKIIPKVKSVKGMGEVGTGMLMDKLSAPGEFVPGKLVPGFQGVWNFKNDQPNNYFTRKESPTSPGEKKR